MTQAEATKKQNPQRFKKIGLVVAGVVVVFFVTLLAIPLFVDVNAKVRPLIQDTIEDVMDVQAEVGNLSLSLLWGIHVGVESLKVTETQSKNVLFEMSNSTLQIPYWALFAGQISVTLKTDEPTIRLIRYADGSLNVSKILKTEGATTQGKEEAEGNSGAKSSSLGNRILFSLDMKKSNIHVDDRLSKFKFQLEDLDVALSRVGLNRDFDFSIKSKVDVNNKKDTRLQGSFALQGKTHIAIKNGEFESASVRTDLDLSDLGIRYADLINKTKETQLKAYVDILIREDQAQIHKAQLRVDKFEILTQGTVQNFSKPRIDLKITSNELDLASWRSIVSPLADMNMQGRVSFNIAAQGSVENPSLEGGLELKNGALRVAAIKPPISNLHLNTTFHGYKINLKDLSLNIGKSDFKVTGSLENIQAPEIQITTTSQLIDLDEMFPPEGATAAQPSGKGGSGASMAGEDLDLSDSLAEVRSNDLLKKVDLKASARAAQVIVSAAKLEDVRADLFFKALILTIKNASLKSFGGTAKAFVQMDMSKKTPRYQASADVVDIDINQAVVSQFKDLDKMLTGKANGNVIINGMGASLSVAKQNLTGSGKFRVKDGAWSGAVPLKKLGENLSKIPKAGEKLSKVNVDDRFKTLDADFSIQNETIYIQKALVDTVMARTAIDMSGTLGFDQKLQLKGNILAPIKDAPKEITASDGRGRIPFEVQGTATSPKVEWKKTVEPVAKAYAKDEGKKALKKETEKVKEKMGDKVKDLFKGIKF